MINEQRKQINDLTLELQKAHCHIDSLYQISDGGLRTEKDENSEVMKSNNLSFTTRNSQSDGMTLNSQKSCNKPKFKAKTLYKPQIQFASTSLSKINSKKMSEFDENAIRAALASSEDKTILIEKLLNVLKLARTVQQSNQHLRNDMMQMSQIIEDLNDEITGYQQEIEHLYETRENQSNHVCT